jgi:hypothetical protein
LNEQELAERAKQAEVAAKQLIEEEAKAKRLQHEKNRLMAQRQAQRSEAAKLQSEKHAEEQRQRQADVSVKTGLADNIEKQRQQELNTRQPTDDAARAVEQELQRLRSEDEKQHAKAVAFKKVENERNEAARLRDETEKVRLAEQERLIDEERQKKHAAQAAKNAKLIADEKERQRQREVHMELNHRRELDEEAARAAAKQKQWEKREHERLAKLKAAEDEMRQQEELKRLSILEAKIAEQRGAEVARLMAKDNEAQRVRREKSALLAKQKEEEMEAVRRKREEAEIAEKREIESIRQAEIQKARDAEEQQKLQFDRMQRLLTDAAVSAGIFASPEPGVVVVPNSVECTSREENKANKKRIRQNCASATDLTSDVGTTPSPELSAPNSTEGLLAAPVAEENTCSRIPKVSSPRKKKQHRRVQTPNVASCETLAAPTCESTVAEINFSDAPLGESGALPAAAERTTVADSVLREACNVDNQLGSDGGTSGDVSVNINDTLPLSTDGLVAGEEFVAAVKRDDKKMFSSRRSKSKTHNKSGGDNSHRKQVQSADKILVPKISAEERADARQKEDELADKRAKIAAAVAEARQRQAEEDRKRSESERLKEAIKISEQFEYQDKLSLLKKMESMLHTGSDKGSTSNALTDGSFLKTMEELLKMEKFRSKAKSSSSGKMPSKPKPGDGLTDDSLRASGKNLKNDTDNKPDFSHFYNDYISEPSNYGKAQARSNGWDINSAAASSVVELTESDAAVEYMVNSIVDEVDAATVVRDVHRTEAAERTETESTGQVIVGTKVITLMEGLEIDVERMVETVQVHNPVDLFHHTNGFDSALGTYQSHGSSGGVWHDVESRSVSRSNSWEDLGEWEQLLTTPAKAVLESAVAGCQKM